MGKSFYKLQSCNFGGTSESRQLMQIITDITGCPQNLPRQKLAPVSVMRSWLR
jgi:hypothetical protein